jgi:hypothetical protein
MNNSLTSSVQSGPSILVPSAVPSSSLPVQLIGGRENSQKTPVLVAAEGLFAIRYRETVHERIA